LPTGAIVEGSADRILKTIPYRGIVDYAQYQLDECGWISGGKVETVLSRLHLFGHTADIAADREDNEDKDPLAAVGRGQHGRDGRAEQRQVRGGEHAGRDVLHVAVGAAEHAVDQDREDR